jgi:stage V sporulation protein AF
MLTSGRQGGTDPMVEKNTKKLSASFEENIRYMNEILPVKESFDIIRREMEIGGKASVFYYIDGFIKDEAMLKIMDSFLSVSEKDMPGDAEEFIQKNVPYVEVDILEDFDQVIRNVLSGPAVLFIDGYKECIAIDCRTYPARSVDEPDKDRSLRGSRDGFVETIVFNTALMRRRIRDPHLVMEMTEAGQTSRTDIALCYMQDRVDPELLKNLKNRIESLQIDDLRMNQQSLAEALFKRKWFNPFPKFKFTERPDTAAACLLEGKVVILVDNSPSAMILPTSILDMIEEANDYYFPTVTAVYLKVTRGLITIATVFFTPLYLLFMQNQDWLPEAFEFVAVRDTVNIPLIFQFLLLELSIDGLRLAAMNTPTMLSTPLSVIAGIVMGEFSVQSGWFNSEVMLYMAFVAVANYTQPNFELGYALKFMRLMLLVLTAVFDLYGFIIGCILVVCFLIFNKTLSGRNYLNVKLN